MIKNKNNRNKSNSSSKKNVKKAAPKPKYNMLVFGKANGQFVETRNGKEAFKVNISVVTDESSYNATDENGREYTAEEAIVLVNAAIEKGQRISCFCFENDETSDYGDTHSGNARIDLSKLKIDEVLAEYFGDSEDDEDEEEEEPAPAPKKKSSATKKRNYEQEIEETEEKEEYTELEAADIPY